MTRREREREAAQRARVGVLMDFDGTDTEPTTGICSRCFRRRPLAALILDMAGGMVCQDDTGCRA